MHLRVCHIDVPEKIHKKCILKNAGGFIFLDNFNKLVQFLFQQSQCR